MECTTFLPQIQMRIGQVKQNLLRCGFSRPAARFVGDMLFGLLKSRHVHVTAISRALGEDISQKKTWERLRRGLSRVGLFERLSEAHLKRHSGQIGGMGYCIIDMSDVQKRYAQQMEGLALVRDGSGQGRNDLGPGYWWLNGVMSDGQKLLPVHSEMFSVEAEASEYQSENKKMVALAERIHRINPHAIMVIDRGGDRGMVMGPLLGAGIPFVIRGMSRRHLGLHADSTRQTKIEVIAHRTRLTQRYTVRRTGCHGRPTTRRFDVGIKRVYLGEHPLWLVVCKRLSSGLSWFLTNLEGRRAAVMKHAMHAYTERWRIEEYHRQIKGDFHLEEIALREYEALKTMSVLVMMAAAFLATLGQWTVAKILSATGVLPRKRLSDVPRYPFYMICRAVGILLQSAVKRRPVPLWTRKRHVWQLELDLKTQIAT